MSPEANPNPPRQADAGAAVGKLLSAAVGRALGELPDEEKAGILVGLTVAIQELTLQVAGLREDLGALVEDMAEVRNIAEAWDSILAVYVTDPRGRAFKSVAKEVVEASVANEQKQKSADGDGSPDASAEPDDKESPPVIEADFTRTK